MIVIVVTYGACGSGFLWLSVLLLGNGTWQIAGGDRGTQEEKDAGVTCAAGPN